jgi:hypothetical protein
VARTPAINYLAISVSDLESRHAKSVILNDDFLLETISTSAARSILGIDVLHTDKANNV